ncbi:helix-turn-helix domain-containing protein [Chamaesiphon polymorphus]|uniref:AraC family transcriptional regulator n=1 Tax=Chamaesiphon polymorphus CCALA 037 TaxID=2107692 RepID=A0A2T1G730_9CYAN|nr:AraC family transcriptional regulator [Chamaesiphon polymorphus]PSB53052.1 AraC family transcriptional regulator [Chamaesiphon polymorphus CCALA 037]
MFDLNNLSSVLPQPPLLSSQNAGWEDIQLALFRQPPHETPQYRSPYHTICINWGSGVTLEQSIEGADAAARSTCGDMSFYNANRSQVFRWDRETEFLQLYIEPNFFHQIATELQLTCDLAEVELLVRSDKLVLQIADSLKNSLADGGGCKLYAAAMARSLAIHVLNRYRHPSTNITQTPGLSTRQIQQVTEYIRDRLSSDLSLAELAACISLSPYHFARLFKQTTKMTPHQYVIDRRVELASKLLSKKELSIAEVALCCGFAHQGHLSKHFKRSTGITPKTYRDNF